MSKPRSKTRASKRSSNKRSEASENSERDARGVSVSEARTQRETRAVKPLRTQRDASDPIKRIVREYSVREARAIIELFRERGAVLSELEVSLGSSAWYYADARSGTRYFLARACKYSKPADKHKWITRYYDEDKTMRVLSRTRTKREALESIRDREREL